MKNKFPLWSSLRGACDEAMTATGEEVKISDTAIDKMCQHLVLLHQWNKTYNLTAINDLEEMVSKHVADSLAILPYLTRVGRTHRRFLDVGSGPGFPGVPLALALTDTHWTLLDSNGKKTRFLQHIKATLQIENIEIIQSRVETFIPTIRFDGVVSRAWTQLPEMIKKTQHLYADKGRLWAMKGVYPAAELAQIELPFEVHHIEVPGLGEQRHLIEVIY